MEKGQNWTDWVREKSDPRAGRAKPEALDDLTVLDLSYKSFAGCYCSSLLAEFGAEVIRIEPPEGDFIRTCTPYGMLFKGEGLNYLTEGRNKFHVTLNLKEPEGREILRGLVSQADVLIETFRPGVMDEWGIGYQQLKEINPGLIFASITANGQFGPLSQSRMPDYDNIAQARSGIQAATGEVLPEGKSYDDCPWAVPTKAGPWIGWSQPATFMAVGILAALHWRFVTGEGQALDVATNEAYSRFDNDGRFGTRVPVLFLNVLEVSFPADGFTVSRQPRMAPSSLAGCGWKCGRPSPTWWGNGMNGMRAVGMI